jgi:hypothetical protein
MNNTQLYDEALRIAMDLMREQDQEPTSAFKEAGRMVGIEYGPDMESFVEWARDAVNERRLTEKFEEMEAKEYPAS